MYQNKDSFSDNSHVEKSYADSAYNALPYALCTMDRNLNIIWANKNFHQFSEMFDGMSCNQIFQKLDMKSRNQLSHLFSGQSIGEKILFTENVAEPILFLFKAIHRVYEEYATFIVSEIQPIDLKLDKSLEKLQVKYGLSFAEISIGKLLALGNSTTEIAETRNVSIATVRAQLRQLREKMDVRSSIEITRRIYINCLLEQNDFYG